MRVLLVYDPVPPGVYTGTGHQDTVKKEYVRVGSVVDYLLGISSSYRGVAMVFIALPSDLYEHAKSYLEGTRPDRSRLLRERAVDLDAESRGWRRELVRRILEAYSGCSDLEGLAGRIAKLESSHALVAKYAGLLLKERGCRVSDLGELVSGARGRSEEIVEHIVRARLGLPERPTDDVTKERMGKYAEILALRRPFTDIPFGEYIATPTLMSYLMEYVGLKEEDIKRNQVWLSMKNEDLVERVLSKIVEEAKGTLDRMLVEVLREQKGKSRAYVAKYILDKWGDKLKSLVDQLARDDPVCWRKAIFIVGSAPFEATSSLPLEDYYKDFVEELAEEAGAGRECLVEKLLTAEDRMPALVVALILISSYIGRLFVKPGHACSLLRQTLEDLQDLPGKRIDEHRLPYLLGLAMTSLEGRECIDGALRLLRFLLDSREDLMILKAVKSIADNVANRLIAMGEAAPLVQLALLLAHHGSPSRALEIVAKARWGSGKKLEPWEMALLAEALLELLPKVWGSKGSYDLARVILDDIVRETTEGDAQLGEYVRLYVKLHSIQRLVAFNVYTGALTLSGELRRGIGKLREAIKERGESVELRKFTKHRFIGLKSVEDLLRGMENAVLQLEADSHLGLGLRLGNRDQLIEASKKYNELAERVRGRCLYFNVRLASVASKVIAAEGVGDEVFEELGKLLLGAFRSDCRDEVLHISTSLWVLMSASGQRPTEEDLRRARSFLRPLQFSDPVKWAVLSLLLYVLTNGSLGSNEIPDPDMLLKTFRDEVTGTLDEEGLRDAMAILRRSGFPERGIERYAPDLVRFRTWQAHIAFLLRALADRDFMRAAAHAALLAHRYPALSPGLMESLRRAAETGSLDERSKLLLARIWLFLYAT